MKQLLLKEFAEQWSSLIEINISGNKQRWRRLLKSALGETWYIYSFIANDSGLEKKEAFELVNQAEVKAWMTVSLVDQDEVALDLSRRAIKKS
ncbi:MAG: hypothetical protein HQL52_19155 [Magnetococcales bacterium]|nr:hypothetical protein [Magnetococcales bacterium]